MRDERQARQSTRDRSAEAADAGAVHLSVFEPAVGTTVVEHCEPGEVVWLDDAGVNCRGWNWRQARRMALTDGTTAALSILEAPAPLTDDALAAAADDRVAHLTGLGPDVRVARRLLGPS